MARPGVLIHASAKPRFRKLAGRTPARLSIGEGTICECSIVADRPEAEVSIGRNTFIGASNLIAARSITIGDDVLISWGCTIVDHHSHALDWPSRENDVRDWYQGKKDWSAVHQAPIIIGDRVWIGFNTIILAGVRVGNEAVIGCGSIVTRDVPDYAVVAGNPARIIREDSRVRKSTDAV
ncbi:acyltransferase [uncultured Sphingomonas sp.]|uniref:acyltransferase n=1 Tax=uncultured Sphingomonas sp. TaxID=158754 RepID=UPI0025F9F60E|nr:acyltransferase [uncultured Sphingomonas sp.]